jgi:DMSO reductase anchor subunit
LAGALYLVSSAGNRRFAGYRVDLIPAPGQERSLAGVTHLKKSWLSREVLMAGLFGAVWAVTAGLRWLHKDSNALWLVALLGIGLIYSMSRVYYLKTVPSWNTWRTTAAFFLSAAVLGALGVNLIAPHPGWGVAACLAQVVELGMLLARYRLNQASCGSLGRLGIDRGAALFTSRRSSVQTWVFFSS